MTTAISTAVVIPYYQREPGILRRALRSVRAQTVLEGIETRVIVVDDSSPVPAETEATPGDDIPSNIEILRQENGGPGAARNRALDTLAEACRYVAFLDSDDEWRPGHLGNAVRTLEAGHDFYFSDFFFCNYREASAFRRANRIRGEDHQRIDGPLHAYAYQGDFNDQILVTGNVVGTSNVVFRVAGFETVRFSAGRIAGEDYEFWLNLAKLGARIAFSTEVECDCGLGVNVFARTEWGSAEHLVRLRDELATWSAADQNFVRTPQQREANQARIRRLREEVWKCCLHLLRHREGLDRDVMRSLGRVDPGFWTASVPTLARVVLGRLRR